VADFGFPSEGKLAACLHAVELGEALALAIEADASLASCRDLRRHRRERALDLTLLEAASNALPIVALLLRGETLV
jgi:hypothetical protein